MYIQLTDLPKPMIEEGYNKLDNRQENYKNDPSMQDDLPPVCFCRMFRFADRLDYLFLAIGFIFAAVNGVSLMFYANPFGQLTDSFAPNVDKQEIVDKTKEAMFGFLKNSVLVFIGSWIMSATWTISSQRQAIKCRKQYLRALLNQQPGWHDRKKSTELAEKMYNQTNQLQTAIGSKISSFLMAISMVVGGIIIALTRGWKMAIVLLGFVPVMLITGAVNNRVSKQADLKTTRISNRLAGNGLQVLENIRTVKVLNGQQYELDRYEKTLALLRDKSSCYGWIKNFIGSLCYFCVIMNYTLGFWYGSVLVSRQEYNESTRDIYSVADVIVIFFTIYTSNLNLGQIPDCLTAFEVGAKASSKIFSVLDRTPSIISGEDGVPVIESIQFQKVNFHYNQPLFSGLNLSIAKGRTAFVGESGSGKSTIVNLIMRFYDPISGQVCFNGKSVTQFNLDSLRQSIGYVGQQPVLLGKTIRQALVADKKDNDQVVRALKIAEAWNFVKDIGIDKEFGMLSGGQKQRIAIARAILKNPQLLILDQATSALDRVNEKQIQKTLNNLRVPFVLMVAHKIQTVQKADYIYVLDRGRISQQGTYQQLIDRKGRLYQLATKQKAIADEEGTQGLPNIVRAPSLKEDRIQKKISNKEDKKQQQAEEEKEHAVFKWSYFWGMFSINISKFPLIVIGVICAIYIGCVFPMFSFFISRLIVVLSSVKYSPPDQRYIYIKQSEQLSFSLLIISIVAYFACAIRGSVFVIAQQSLNYLMKKTLFKKLLSMRLSFFDTKGSAYCSTLISDVDVASRLGSTLMWDIFENSAALICGLGIAFVSCWQMTLVALGVIPVLLVAGKIQAHFIGGFSSDTDLAYKHAHEKVVQALLNYKTVVAFNLQSKISNDYDQLLQAPLKIAVKRGNIAGISFGVAQALISCIFALIFYVGAILIRDHNITVLAVYTSIYAIMFSAMSAGGNLRFVSSIIDSKVKLSNVMEVIQNTEDEQGNQQDSVIVPISGTIQFKNVGFTYPLRNVAVFENLNFKIQAGQKVALVGSSGCGKSTVVGLILRLYKPDSGNIVVDGQRLSKLNLKHLRRSIGVVSQQPALFNRTVFENIKYNTLSASYADIEQATRKSNAYQFIQQGKFGIGGYSNEQPPQEEKGFYNQQEIKVEGFLRKVGIKGGFLSGGQKQRIAIARTIARKPRLMLLDQATSALDTVNEELVQQALQNIKGTTQVIVAHRISTIKGCDKIIMFQKGRIVEQGSFAELVAKRGSFYRMAQGNIAAKQQ